ncbi:hypothetical protein [Actinoplanes sp. NPDC020271]|uniref:hypothetical protein n=1 Tax=Actinoplanes sp. NPDC020271 TaxID=3363896 RepID=UPI003790533D
MATRRQLLSGAALAAGAVALPGGAAGAAAPAGLFPLGVTSGDPLPAGVVLWTRLISDHGLPRRAVEVD